MRPPITNTVCRRLEEPPETVARAVGHLDPLQPMTEALAALGCSGHARMQKCHLPAGTPDTTAFSLTWLLADESVADVTWTLSVLPFGDGGTSMLSACVRAGTQSSAADEQLLTAWPVLGRIVETHTARLLNAVAVLAEDLTENPPQPMVTRLAA